MRKPVLIDKALAWGWLYCVIFAAVPAAFAGDDKKAPSVTPEAREYSPRIAPESDEAKRALRAFRVPPGLNVEVFAAEPLLANPVAFCIDEKGVFYVAETFRHGAGVTDTREHMNWLDADLACRTVADRVAMYQKYLGKQFAEFDQQHERVRRIVDRDQDGRADHATVFADGFNDPAAGIGAGVLARRDTLWYACIPWLWKLRDRNGDGRAEERTLLHEGYGVHVGFLGHDLHGLKFGPDGKLYFSIGDRGFNVESERGRSLAVRDTGSVLRCNPDGTGLEVFATGLRNPQELAFDQYGNLFTGDNNSDSGDRARWVYVVEGGDSGWRIGYQFMERPVSRGPWNEERLWYPAFPDQAAYIVPPIANLADGPSGLTFEPGTSQLPAQFKNHFFLVDFRGSSSQSGIRSFALEPKGASFRLTNSERFIWSVLATDVDFGPDGALYFSDWVEGWDKPNKGRIYRAGDRGRSNDALVREVKGILAEGLASRSHDALAGLLAHPDMRVRQEAQFELVGRGEAGWKTLAEVARSHEGTLARIHAIWGLGQAAGALPSGGRRSQWAVLGPLLGDPDPEVRGQAAKVLGEIREPKAIDGLVGLLEDSSPRVRFLAAIAVGKLGSARGIGPVLQMLRANADQDPYLRHAGVMGLVGSGNAALFEPWARDSSPAVRMGVLLAMRRLEAPTVAQFLKDADPRLVLEAARAIHDVPIAAAIPELAAVRLGSSPSLPLARRVLNANFRLGGGEHAAALAEAGARSDLPQAARVLALEMLADWTSPSGRDKVLGLWRPILARPGQIAADSVRPRIAELVRSAPANIKSAAVLTAVGLGIKEAGESIAALVADKEQSDRTRALALKGLDELGDSRRVSAAQAALLLPGSRSRTEALRVLAKVDPAKAIAPVQDRLENGSPTERQGAIAILAAMPGDVPRETLLSWVDRLIAGKVPEAIQLDLLEAAGRRKEPEFQRRLAQYESSKPKGDLVAAYREALLGGDSQRGMSLFTTKTELECLRCHKVRNPSGEAFGGEVGPDLSGIGGRQTRAYLLEAIVDPSKQIAQGFESVVLATTDGKVHTGVLRGEDDHEVRLITAEGTIVAVPKSSIDERKRGPSAMPGDLVKKLTKTDLRDLIEFLASLKAK
jgi:quinoprotein glucose dehydrogenase